MQRPTPATTVRLTDQALVSVHLARALAGSRKANVGHLLAGILSESDGRAGRRVRLRVGGEPGLRVCTHAGLTAPGLVPLQAALIALPVASVPAWTDDLLGAAVRVGGADLADLLDQTGITLPDPLPFEDAPSPESVLEGDEVETFGRGTMLSRGFDDEADRALACARAQGTGSLALLPWLDVGCDTAASLTRLPEVPIAAIVDRALVRGGEARAGLGDLATALLSMGLEAMSTRRQRLGG